MLGVSVVLPDPFAPDKPHEGALFDIQADIIQCGRRIAALSIAMRHMVQTDDRMLRLAVVPYRQRLDDGGWSVTHLHAGGFQQSTFPGK